jgi:trehalose-6-phosphatase
MLQTLSRDPKNTIFLINSAERSTLDKWLELEANASIRVGVAAENGFFFKYGRHEEWLRLSMQQDEEKNDDSWKV